MVLLRILSYFLSVIKSHCERLLQAHRSLSTGVLQVRDHEALGMLDLPDGVSPLSLPVFADMQDVLHEDVYVDEDPVALKVLDDILFVLGAVEFFGLFCGAYQLL